MNACGGSVFLDNRGLALRATATDGGPPSVAQIGISGYGRAYLEWVESAMKAGRIRLVAVVVINRQEERAACARLAAQGVEIFEDWEAMLDVWRGRLDLCLAPVPISLHARVAVAALEAGANVLMEKPLAATLEQAVAIREAERRTGRWVAVGYQDAYTESSRRIASHLADGRIGRVRSIRWLGLWPRSTSYYHRTPWAGRISVDGQPVRDSPLNNAMGHFLNLAFLWAWAGTGGPPEPTTVEAELYRAYPIESFDTGVMRVGTSAGVTILSAVSHCCPVERPLYLRVLGDEGELRWTHRQEAVWTSGHGETERLALEGGAETLEAMFATVLARLGDPDAPICSTTQAVLQVQTIEGLPEGIHTIDESQCEQVSRDGETWQVVRGIEEDLSACVKQNALPSEIQADWAGLPSLVAT